MSVHQDAMVIHLVFVIMRFGEDDESLPAGNQNIKLKKQMSHTKNRLGFTKICHHDTLSSAELIAL